MEHSFEQKLRTLQSIITAQGPHSKFQDLNIKGAGTLTAQEALEVYQEGYRARLTDQLCETFEAVWSVLSDDLFFELSRAYINRQASLSYNLSDYGEKFPEFLKNFSPEIPFLSELAEFEWHFKELFHKKQDVSLKMEPNSLRDDVLNYKIEFVSSFTLMQFKYDVYEIWLHRKNEMFALESIAWNKPSLLIGFRADLHTRFHRISTLDFFVLNSLFEGKTLGESLAMIENRPDLNAHYETIKNTFSFLFTSGVIARLRG